MDTQEVQEVKDLVIAEGRIGEMLLEKYNPAQYHVIVPTHVITIPEEIMELGVSVVHLSPNPKDGMVYPFPEAGPGMVALAKKGMEAISNAAGLTDEPSTQVAFESGHLAIAEATVSCTLPTGEIIRRTRQKCIDVDARMREHEYNLRDRIEQRKEKGFASQGKDESNESFTARREKYVEDKCMKRRLQLEKFLWELANTGAHLRAMKALLPSLKETYHFSELKKPFIVPRISIRPAVASSKLLAAAMKARARQNITELFSPIDQYEDLPPELAAELREKDRLLAEMAEEFESGELMREALVQEIRADEVNGWELMQEAYRGSQPPEVEVVVIEGEKSQSGEWPKRPWKAGTLKDYLNNVKVPAYKGKKKEPSDEQLDFVHSILNKLASNDAERHTITLYLFDVESTSDLTAAQCSALIGWARMVPPDYEPSTHAVEEAKRVIRQYQVDRGQQELPL